MKSVLIVYAMLVTVTACTTDAEPATDAIQSQLLGMECKTPGWGFDYSDELVLAAEDYGMDCDPDPFGDPFGGGGGDGWTDPGVCSLFDGSVSGSGTGTGRSTAVSLDDYQKAIDRASAEGTSQAKNAAGSNASSNCRSRLFLAPVPGFCHGRANSPFAGAQGTGCHQIGAEYPPDGNTVVIMECAATASVQCEFEYSLSP